MCAVLLNELNLIDEITFVHPKDMQDGKVAITFARHHHQPALRAGVHLVFDHHESETVRNAGRREYQPRRRAHAPSAARVPSDNHYGGKAAFPASPKKMMAAVDRRLGPIFA